MSPARWRAAAVLTAGGASTLLWAVLAPRVDLGPHLATSWIVAIAVQPALLVAALLLARLPGHALGRVLTLNALSHVTTISAGVFARWLDQRGLSGADVVQRVADVAWVGTLPSLAVLVLVFPRPPERGVWRWLLHYQLATLAVGAVSVAARWQPPPLVAAFIGLLVVGIAGALRLVWRWWRSEGEERAQLAWFAWAAAAAAAFYVVGAPLSALGVRLPGADTLLFGFLVGGMPAVLGLAVLRRRLYGIEVVVNRTLVWLAVSAGSIALYVTASVLLSRAVGDPVPSLVPSLVPAALVAAALVPLRTLSQRAVDRLMYGDRDEPARAVRRLGDRLAVAVAPEDVPGTIVSVVHDALRVPWVAVDLERDGERERAADRGRRPAGVEPEMIGLAHRGERLGRLLVAARAGEPELSPRDRSLLEELARQAGVALYAARAGSELLRSRERLVLGREEERRRLRRDLHDGLSPSLAGASLAVEAALSILEDDPAEARRILEQVAREVRASGDTVRRLLADLRPPRLDEVGLVAALEERASRFSTGTFLDVEILAGDVPTLPPAVEVAAYRIAVEAITNAARHAGARRCLVRIGADEVLRLVVEDDGRGFVGEGGEGVGLSSMRERAVDVGGRLEVVSEPGQGTRVEAELPLEVPV